MAGKDIYYDRVEKTDRCDRPLTKEEQSKPLSSISNRWIYAPSGKLTFLIDEYWSDFGRKRWTDKRGKPLEELLIDIVIGPIVAGEAVRLHEIRCRL